MDIQTGPMHKFTKYLDSCWNLGKRKQLDSSWAECAWIVSQKDIDTSGCQAWFFLAPNTPNTYILWDRTTLVLQLQGWDGWSGVCPKVFTGISSWVPPSPTLRIKINCRTWIPVQIICLNWFMGATLSSWHLMEHHYFDLCWHLVIED